MQESVQPFRHFLEGIDRLHLVVVAMAVEVVVDAVEELMVSSGIAMTVGHC